MTENKFVDFTITNGVDEIKGYWNTENVEDDEKNAIFLSREGFEQNYVPWNPYDMDKEFEKWESYEDLTSSFQSDSLFFDFLYDFKDENYAVIREGYLLVINDGEIYLSEKAQIGAKYGDMLEQSIENDLTCSELYSFAKAVEDEAVDVWIEEQGYEL